MNKRLLPAYLLTFVNVLGMSILMPVLPFVVESYDAPKWIYGLLLTLYSVFQFFGAPYLGRLSDSNGRKPILLISQAGTLLSWFIFLLALYLPETPFLGFALPLWIIGLSRILDGITGGNTSVANAYVSDITTREEKSYIFGYLGGIGGLGLIIGPGLGGFSASSSWGYVGTILTAIGISSLTLLTIFWLLKESLPKENRRAVQKQSIWLSLRILKRIRITQPSHFIKVLFVLKFFFSTTMAFYISTIPLFMIDLFAFDEGQLGTFMLAVGGFMIFNQAVMSKQFIKRLGEYNTLLLGLALVVMGLVCITLTNNLWIYLAFYYVMNLGLSLCFPTFNALISIHANPQKQGEIMGVSESINSLAMALFPVIGATMYSIFSFNLYYFVSALPFIALIIAFSQKKRIAASEA